MTKMIQLQYGSRSSVIQLQSGGDDDEGSCLGPPPRRRENPFVGVGPDFVPPEGRGDTVPSSPDPEAIPSGPLGNRTIDECTAR